MAYKDYSINSTVLVKLNSIGRAMWKQHHAQHGKKASELPPETDGWTPFKLHKLMLVFGQGCFQGADMPFSVNIRIEDN